MKQTKRGGLDPTANYYTVYGHVPLVVEFRLCSISWWLFATDGVVSDSTILDFQVLQVILTT
jgi:hypothetical protein